MFGHFSRARSLRAPGSTARPTRARSSGGKPARCPFEKNDYKTTEVLELTPWPCLANLSPRQYRELIENLIEKFQPKRLPSAKKRERWHWAPLGSRNSVHIPSRTGSKDRRRRAFMPMQSP